MRKILLTFCLGLLFFDVFAVDQSGTVTFYGSSSSWTPTNDNASVTFTYPTISKNGSSTKICNVSSKYGIKGKNTTILQITCPTGYYFKNVTMYVASFGNSETPTCVISSGETTLYSPGAQTYTKLDQASCGTSVTLEDEYDTFESSKFSTLTVAETGNSKNLCVTKMTYTIAQNAACSTPAAPTAVTASSTTSSGTTLTITDAANAASYDIYYSTSSTAPVAGTAANTTSTSKTKALTGLTASTTYYVWVRSVCDSDHKSTWTALTGSSFTTLCTSHTVNATTNNASYGTAAAASTTVCEGSTTTVTATPKSGYSFVSWAVSGTGSSLSSTSTNPTTLTMGTANATVTATFGCATPSAPSALVASSTTSSGTTLTITDAANTNNYDIYYSTSSTAPEAGTSATTTSTNKTKALTGLSASTTYYVWVRSVCDSTHKSTWTALTGSTFTTDAACTDPGLTITLN